MRTSDLIRELCEVIGTHGDLPVFLFDGAERHALEVMAATHRTGNVVFLWTKDRWPYKQERSPLNLAAPDLLAGCKAALGAFERNDCINWDDLRRAIEKAELPAHPETAAPSSQHDPKEKG